MQDVVIETPKQADEPDENQDKPAVTYAPTYRADVERIACELLVHRITEGELPTVAGVYVHELSPENVQDLAQNDPDLLVKRIAVDPTWCRFVEVQRRKGTEEADLLPLNHERYRADLAEAIESFRYDWDGISAPDIRAVDKDGAEIVLSKNTMKRIQNGLLKYWPDGSYSEAQRRAEAERQQCEKNLLRAIVQYADAHYERLCAKRVFED